MAQIKPYMGLSHNHVLLGMQHFSIPDRVGRNYPPVSNVPFVIKVIEWAIAGQLQAFLDKVDGLDPFQTRFRPDYGTEPTLVTLVDDLHREMEEEVQFCYFSWTSQQLSTP